MAFVKIVAYSTKYSQAVTHPSTNSAQCCLTTVIRQELVYSTWYGCKHLQQVKAMSKSKCQRLTHCQLVFLSIPQVHGLVRR